MANAFSFKEVTTKTMKITGMVDTDNMTIDIELMQVTIAFEQAFISFVTFEYRRRSLR